MRENNMDLYVQVFAADLFATKFKDDLLNQHAGLRFRNKVVNNALIGLLFYRIFVTAVLKMLLHHSRYWLQEAQKILLRS
jgi:hypothetical protein